MREHTHQRISAVLGTVLGTVWVVVGAGFFLDIWVSSERTVLSGRGLVALLLLVGGLIFLFAPRNPHTPNDDETK